MPYTEMWWEPVIDSVSLAAETTFLTVIHDGAGKDIHKVKFFLPIATTTTGGVLTITNTTNSDVRLVAIPVAVANSEIEALLVDSDGNEAPLSVYDGDTVTYAVTTGVGGGGTTEAVSQQVSTHGG